MKIIWQMGLAVCLLWMWQANAEIYKWRDEKGVMNYSDTPPRAGVQSAQKIKAATVSSDFPLTRSDAYQREEAASANNKPGAKREAGSEAAVKQSAEAEALKAMQERLKAQNCAAARSNYRNYTVGGRMQSVNENGQKEFLSDEQISEGQARAQQEIDENCPPE